MKFKASSIYGKSPPKRDRYSQGAAKWKQTANRKQTANTLRRRASAAAKYSEICSQALKSRLKVQNTFQTAQGKLKSLTNSQKQICAKCLAVSSKHLMLRAALLKIRTLIVHTSIFLIIRKSSIAVNSTLQNFPNRSFRLKTLARENLTTNRTRDQRRS